ncbi:hypothetical protein [Streptomyces sp. NPDC053069]
MSMQMNDREWSVFMNNALGSNVSEEGLLIDLDTQQDATTWVTPPETEHD